ncbi:MAG: peptidoglycan endopeptidase [Xanthomonadaceae bacterium]|nr:peptidoglycan endopeptidase [Xanthomonadaceae bacterium]
MNIDRFVGIPYCPRRMDCADLAMLVQRELFGREVVIAGRRPRPLNAGDQDAAIAAYCDQLAEPIAQPQDGDIVLMREGGQSMAGHVGTYFFLNYAPCVLHTAAWMQGGSSLHRLQDLGGFGLTVMGYYRWK